MARAAMPTARRTRGGMRSMSSPTRTSSPRRNVWPKARKAVAAHSHATISSAPRNSIPSSRMPACASITAAMAARQTAAAAPLAWYRRSRNRRKSLFSAVTLDDRLAVGAGGLEPFLEDLVADLGEGGLHGGVGLVHRHPVLRECRIRLALTLARHFPAALLRGARRLGEGLLLVLGQPGIRALVHDHDVLGMERARVVVVLDELPGLGGSPRGRRRDHRLYRAGGEHLRHLGYLDHGGARAEKLREARGHRAVGAKLGALQVAHALQRLARVDALPGPGDGIQELQAATLQLLLEHRLLRLVELERRVVAR